MPQDPVPDTATVLDSDASATSDLYQAAIGKVGADYYSRVFARLDADEKTRLGWNWAASLITLNWMAYRQLWGAALAYVGALVAGVLLVVGIGRLAFQFSADTEMALLAGIALLSFVVPGLLGNQLMFKAVRSKVEAALAANTTLPEAAAMLRGQAITRRRGIVLAVANVALAGLAVALYLNLPSVGSLPLESAKMAQARSQASGKAADLSGLPSTPKPAEPAKADASAAAPMSSPTANAPAAAPIPAPAAATGTVTTTIPATTSPATTAPTPPAPPTTSPATTAPVTGTAAARPSASGAVQGTAQSATAATSAVPVTASRSPAASGNAVEEKPKTDTASTTPAPPALGSRSAPEIPPLGKGTASKEKPSKTETKTAPKPEVKPSAATAKAEPAPATKPVQFLVNVGLFADANNARNVYTKLMDAGLTATSQEFSTSKGRRTRVRVGPFETQAEADRNADKVRGLGLEAEVARQP